ncbi:unnamed protein product [Paramecium primaurelia]|uniref:Transmembrane protein n=1 Tax=Paramecium primaurelia TaxID=5886 RepID=A0A8S1PYX2_PARPR|nr:unnamed protein product [Paramecium primaurelia]
MNKYTLIFRDENTEKKYQHQKKYGLNIIIGGMVISFILRTIMKVINFEWVNTGINLGVVAMLIFLRSYSKYYLLKRLSLIITNCGLSIFTFIYEEPSNNMYSHLRGANSALSSLIIVLSGDFPESVVQIIFIQVTKGIYTILYSSQNEYEILTGNILIMIILIYYLYFHHKAIRSQYLLTLVEQKWENVLESIIENQSYFIINFIQDTYQFQIQSQHNCEQYFYDKDYKTFLRQSQIEKSNLEHYFFQQIQLHLNNHNPINSSIIFVKNSLSLFKLKYSIYFTTQPTILIIFETVQQSKNRNINLLYNKIILYNRMLQMSINQIQNQNFLYQRLKHYLQIENVMFQLEKGNFKLQTIKLNKFLMKFSFIQNLSNYQQKKELKITTLPNVLKALFLLIRDFSIQVKDREKQIQNSIFLSYQDVSENQVVLILQGRFQVKQIQNLIDIYKLQFYTILSNIDIYQDKIIKLILKKRIQIPFINKLDI